MVGVSSKLFCTIQYFYLHSFFSKFCIFFLPPQTWFSHSDFVLYINLPKFCGSVILVQISTCLQHSYHSPSPQPFITFCQDSHDFPCCTMHVVSIISLIFHLYDKVSPGQVLHIHTQTDGNDIRPHTAQISNGRTSTDLNLVTA